uniref:Glutathione s-transferase n=1 Tax=Ornithodoros turicata TaxID=34597 RepID=A0A2R5L8P1_9ACAR
MTGTRIIVYNWPASYCCQKVRMALMEKGLPFEVQHIDMVTGEEFEPWYLKLNPKAEVPTIKDGDYVLPDSQQILDYLERKYPTPPLQPRDPGELEKMKKLRARILTVDIRLLTFGTIQYPELSSNRKITSKDLREFTGMQELLFRKAQESLHRNPELAKLLEAKKHKFASMMDILKDVKNVAHYLDSLEPIFDDCENALAAQANRDHFLCSKEFTLADISLCCLLNRIDMVGLKDRYLDKRPKLQQYFKKIQQRKSYKETFAFQNVTEPK